MLRQINRHSWILISALWLIINSVVHCHYDIDPSHYIYQDFLATVCINKSFVFMNSGHVYSRSHTHSHTVYLCLILFLGNHLGYVSRHSFLHGHFVGILKWWKASFAQNSMCPSVVLTNGKKWTSVSFPTDNMGCKKSKLNDGLNGSVLDGKNQRPVRPDQTVYVRDPTSSKPNATVSSTVSGNSISFVVIILVVSDY